MNVEGLREALTEKVGSGMFCDDLAAVFQGMLGRIQNADEEELLSIAEELEVSWTN